MINSYNGKIRIHSVYIQRILSTKGNEIRSEITKANPNPMPPITFSCYFVQNIRTVSFFRRHINFYIAYQNVGKNFDNIRIANSNFNHNFNLIFFLVFPIHSKNTKLIEHKKWNMKWKKPTEKFILPHILLYISLIWDGINRRIMILSTSG